MPEPEALETWLPIQTGRDEEDDEDCPEVPVIWGKRQFWRGKKGRGAEFDGHVGWRMIERMKRLRPEEKYGREFETFLCFERWIIYDRSLRNHPLCRGCWVFGEGPLIVDGHDVRLSPLDAPDWVRGPGNILLLYEEFYHQMDFWWRVLLDPALPLKIVDVVRVDGTWGGVQVVASRVCSFAEAQECMVGFLEELSDDGFSLLVEMKYRSLVHMPYKTVQDHKAIVFGMAAYGEHQCQADTRFSNTVGHRVALHCLQERPPFGRVGFVRDVDGYWPLRMQDAIRSEETDKVQRPAWGKNEKIPYDYSGGRRLAGVKTGFVCECITCRSVGEELRAVK